MENPEYDIEIAIIARDGTLLSKPIADTFVLLPGKAIAISYKAATTTDPSAYSNKISLLVIKVCVSSSVTTVSGL